MANDQPHNEMTGSQEHDLSNSGLVTAALFGLTENQESQPSKSESGNKKASREEPNFPLKQLVLIKEYIHNADQMIVDFLKVRDADNFTIEKLLDGSRRLASIEQVLDLLDLRFEKIHVIFQGTDANLLKDEPDVDGEVNVEVFDPLEFISKLIDDVAMCLARLKYDPMFEKVLLKKEIPDSYMINYMRFFKLLKGTMSALAQSQSGKGLHLQIHIDEIAHYQEQVFEQVMAIRPDDD